MRWSLACQKCHRGWTTDLEPDRARCDRCGTVAVVTGCYAVVPLR